MAAYNLELWCSLKNGPDYDAPDCEDIDDVNPEKCLGKNCIFLCFKNWDREEFNIKNVD